MTMTHDEAAFYAVCCVPDEISPTGSRLVSHPNAEESGHEKVMDESIFAPSRFKPPNRLKGVRDENLLWCWCQQEGKRLYV
jgi:hypothetical protein